MRLSPKFQEALVFAFELHRDISQSQSARNADAGL